MHPVKAQADSMRSVVVTVLLVVNNCGQPAVKNSIEAR